MSLYTISPLTISILENKKSPFYTSSGVLDTVSFLHKMHDTQELNLVGFSPAVYFFLRISNHDPLAFDFMNTVWKAIVDKKNQRDPIHISYAFNNFLNNVLPELDKLGVAYYQNIEWFLAQHQTSDTLPRDLFLLGTKTYLLQGNTYQRPLSAYIPKFDYASISIQDAMTFGLENHMEYEILIQQAIVDKNMDMARFLTYAYAARTFEHQVKKKYSIDKVIEHVWPLMDQQHMSLKDTLTSLRKVVKGRSFFIDILDWTQSVPDHADALTKKAISEIRLSLHDEMQKALSKKNWGTTEYGWARMLVDLPVDDPLYESTRVRIGQSLFAAHLIRTLNIDKVDVFTISADAGLSTFRYVMGELKDSGQLEKYIETIIKHTPLERRAKVLQHPVFQAVFDMPQLFNRQMKMVQECTESAYAFWRKYLLKDPVTDSAANARSHNFQSSITDFIQTIAGLHQQMQTTTPLKEVLSSEMYSQIWGMVAFSIILMLDSNSPHMDPSHTYDQFGNSFVPSKTGTLDFPVYITMMMILDPDFIASHEQDVKTILQASDTKSVRNIYLGWVDEILGPLHRETGLLETFIHSPKELIQFFGNMYAQRHPELGTVQQEIEIGDLF